MRILWVGEDTSLDVPIGGNLIRRQPEFKGETVHSSERIDLLLNGDLSKYDVIAYWGGISNKELLDTVPLVKQRTNTKLITLLRATGTGIPAWNYTHQLSIIKNLPLFDAVFTPHWDHFQYCKALGVNVFHLPHAIDFSKYPTRAPLSEIPEDATIAIGSGGLEPHRGLFWSALSYKVIKKYYPKVRGVVPLPAREHKTTVEFIGYSLQRCLEDIVFCVGGVFGKYIKDIADQVDVALLNLMTTGNSRTLLDYAVLNIPCIHPSNVQHHCDPFPDLKTFNYSSVLEYRNKFDSLVKDWGFYRKVMGYSMKLVKEHDVKIIVELFKGYLEEIL